MPRNWCTREMCPFWRVSFDSRSSLLRKVHDNLLHFLSLSGRTRDSDSSRRRRSVILTCASELRFWWTAGTDARLSTVAGLEGRELWAAERGSELILCEWRDGAGRRGKDTSGGKSDTCLGTVTLVQRTGRGTGRGRKKRGLYWSLKEGRLRERRGEPLVNGGLHGGRIERGVVLDLIGLPRGDGE